jgi:two-component system, OmpR family, sensor kinase
MGLAFLTIRRRILLIQAIVALAVLAMLAASFSATRSFNYFLTRSSMSHQQLDAVTTLARAADEYSEKVAAFLSTGAEQQREIARLHGTIAASFDALLRSTERERAFLVENGMPWQVEEFERVTQLHRAYWDLYTKVDALIAARLSGGHELARRVFDNEIARGLDDEFEALIAAATAEEMDEIATADRDAREVAGLLRWLTLATTLLAVLGAAVAGYFLYRSIARPIARLSAGATAMAKGDLSTRVGSHSADELGMLARQFDEMATRIQTQQDELRASHAHLEDEVKARTAELEVSNALLRDRDRSRAEFLTDISHELRTPITILRGEAEVTLRSGEAHPAAYRETLRRIADQAGELGRLTEDLLAVARSETDGMAFLSEPFDLPEVVIEAVKEAQILGGPRRVRIEAAADVAAVVRGDARRMKQTMLILLDNAVKYATSGSSVAVDARRAGANVVVKISNRGERMNADELPRLLTRAYRGHARPDRPAGSGLGLSIARWMIEKHDGSIALAPGNPDGLEVTLRFPAVADALFAEETQPARIPAVADALFAEEARSARKLVA